MNKPILTRRPAVAGLFYPDHPGELRAQLQQFLNEQPEGDDNCPKAIIVPHAGTIFSGSIAAAAYRHLQHHQHTIRKVILLGPSHRVFIRGLAAPTVQLFQTPLGDIELDNQSIQRLARTFPQVQLSDWAHAEEHSLEVQLPFLQIVLHDFQLVPLAVGEATSREIAEVLDELWDGDETLIVVSSDLSHFHSYHQAQQLDQQTATLIEAFNGDDLPEHSACGRIPIRGLLAAAMARNMTIQRYDLRNSGDTAGPREQVVGYGSWGFYSN